MKYNKTPAKSRFFRVQVHDGLSVLAMVQSSNSCLEKSGEIYRQECILIMGSWGMLYYRHKKEPQTIDTP